MTSSDAPSDFGTFTFADLAGYSALTEVHGDSHAADLAETFFAEMEALARHHGSEVVKTIGDAVLLRAQQPLNAVMCALDTVDVIAELDDFPTVRIGIHTGTAVSRGGDWFGATVNLAARVSGVAAGGEVLLSAATREAADLGDDVTLEKLPPQQFKNMGEPVSVFRAARPGWRSGRLEIDPVCRMAVAPERSAGALTYGGRTFHFCSLECVRLFSAEPARFSS